MQKAFYAPRGMLQRKPPHGSPCTQCGMCCVATICPLGQTIFLTDAGPCPALRFENEVTKEGSRCGLVEDPMRFALTQTLKHGLAKMREAALHLIGSGTGCDARFNGEPTNHAFYAKLARLDRIDYKKTQEAKKLWQA